MIDKKDKKTNKHQKVWICDYLKRYETKKNSVSEYGEKKLVSNFSVFSCCNDHNNSFMFIFNS